MMHWASNPKQFNWFSGRARHSGGPLLFWDHRKMSQSNRPDHIRLTSHPVPGAKHEYPIQWGAPSARERGPIIGTVSRPQDRNVIGTHGGSYSVYRALAVSSGALNPIRRPDLPNPPPRQTDRAVPEMERATADRLARSVGTSRGGKLREGNRRRHRHPP